MLHIDIFIHMWPVVSCFDYIMSLVYYGHFTKEKKGKMQNHKEIVLSVKQ